MSRARTPIQLGRYRLVERLGAGGMAVVYRALLDGPQGISSTFVLKRILPRLARDPSFVKLFLTEARLTSMLRHPSIAQVHELGESDGEYFLVLEHIDGHDLLRIVRQARARDLPLPIPVVAYIAREILGALAYAHACADAQGRPLEIVHRDVSPSNVMVTRQGAVKLLDFGVAKAASHIRDERTRTGTLKGKISYLSPEQVEGLPIDRRSDLFALGIILHELLTSRRLFRGLDDFATMRMVREARVAPPSELRPEIPAELDGFVLRLLARDASDRFQSGEEALAALRPLLHALHADADGARAFLDELGPIPVDTSAAEEAELDGSDASDGQEDTSVAKGRPRTAPFLPASPNRRRGWLAAGAVGLLGASMAGWLVVRGPTQTAAAPAAPREVQPRPRAVPPPPSSSPPAPSPSAAADPVEPPPAPRAPPVAPARKRSSSRHAAPSRARPGPTPSAPTAAPPEPRKSEIKDPFER